jgi:nucleotide-binding universal stress UspA family protein
VIAIGVNPDAAESGNGHAEGDNRSREALMFETVVWATDGSECADRALPYAKQIVNGGKLVVVHAKEILGGRAGGYPVLADEDDVEATIQQQIAALRAEGLDASFTLATGPQSQAADMIADAAEKVGADLIVVGTRGHAPVAGVLLGSVTQRLLHGSCSVLAVPPPEETTDATNAAAG